jgi:hypothetical protein
MKPCNRKFIGVRSGDLVAMGLAQYSQSLFSFKGNMDL